LPVQQLNHCYTMLLAASCLCPFPLRPVATPSNDAHKSFMLSVRRLSNTPDPPSPVQVLAAAHFCPVLLFCTCVPAKYCSSSYECLEHAQPVPWPHTVMSTFDCWQEVAMSHTSAGCTMERVHARRAWSGSYCSTCT